MVVIHWQVLISTGGGGGGGVVLLQKSYVEAPARPQKFDFLFSNFLPNYPPISIPILIEKHPIVPKLGAFYNNLLKVHSSYVIWNNSIIPYNIP